jgi:hypothetical protein
MTTRPLTARLTTATLAALVGIGLPALTALTMVRAPETGALPTASLERVEVVAKRVERTAQDGQAALLGQTSWTGQASSTDKTVRATPSLQTEDPARSKARSEAPSSAVRRIPM